MKQFDILESQILLRFQGEHSHNTKFGSLMTLLILSVISLRLFFIIKDVFQRNSSQVIFQERQVDNPQKFTISKDTFQIALGMQDFNYEHYIDSSIYSVKLTQKYKIKTQNPTTGVIEETWKIHDIPMQKCTLDNFQNDETKIYFEKINYQNMLVSTVLNIQGDFSSEEYSYLELTVSQCKTDCASPDVIDKYLKFSNFAVQFFDVYIDPTQKEEEFRKYSRDLYWTTIVYSQRMFSFI